jgi:ribosomal protein S4
VDIPSIQVKAGDEIAMREKSRKPRWSKAAGGPPARAPKDGAEHREVVGPRAQHPDPGVDSGA